MTLLKEVIFLPSGSNFVGDSVNLPDLGLSHRSDNILFYEVQVSTMGERRFRAVASPVIVVIFLGAFVKLL